MNLKKIINLNTKEVVYNVRECTVVSRERSLFNKKNEYCFRYRFHIIGGVFGRVQPDKRAHAEPDHARPTGGDLSRDGHEQRRPGRFERVLGNVPTGGPGASGERASESRRRGAKGRFERQWRLGGIVFERSGQPEEEVAARKSGHRQGRLQLGVSENASGAAIPKHGRGRWRC